MATKTITLEIDAYEKLRGLKRPGESFSDVVRRVEPKSAPPSGQDLLRYFQSGGSGVTEESLSCIEEATRNDPPPDDPWA